MKKFSDMRQKLFKSLESHLFALMNLFVTRWNPCWASITKRYYIVWKNIFLTWKLTNPAYIISPYFSFNVSSAHLAHSSAAENCNEVNKSIKQKVKIIWFILNKKLTTSSCNSIGKHLIKLTHSIHKCCDTGYLLVESVHQG